MILVHSQRLSQSALNFRRLAEFFGVDCDLRMTTGSASLAATIEKNLKPESEVLLLDMDSLLHDQQAGDFDAARRIIATHRITVLVLVGSGSTRDTGPLRKLSGAAIVNVNQLDNAVSVRFPADMGSYGAELASQQFSRQKKPGLVLRLGDAADTKVVMEIDGSPSFVTLPAGQSRMYIWSTLDVFDIDRKLSAELEFEQASDQYIPGIIFLRAAHGERCWHNPNQRAGLVIDDPLLQDRYGFIQFKELLASARRNKYHVTLAFIPWNHWQTRTRDISLFQDHRDCFSICVHGCDHTNNEFGSTDYDVLLEKNLIANQRMDRHRTRLGLDFEPLFVCPQEQCSIEAWKAFADSGKFTAMVNTGCMPRNLAQPMLTGADLLMPVQDSFFGFPIFKRHYWRNISPFAMDLFMGRPAILVEHHEFFRDRCAGIEHFARELLKLNTHIKWLPLAETATTTHWRRLAPNGTTDIRFFTSHFKFHHDGNSSTNYRLLKRVPDPAKIHRILLNGSEALYSYRGQDVEIHIGATGTADYQVTIEPRSIEPRRRVNFSWSYKARVAVRRGLSECRDNLIARNDQALRISRKLVKFFKLGGGARPARSD